MSNSNDKISKWKVEVQLDLKDGTQIIGFLFVNPLQRISDLLNDPRDFLPVLTSDGLMVHLSKSNIARLCQLNQRDNEFETSDPFEILGVSHNCDEDEVKDAYHALCRDYHPDRIQGLNLPSDLIALANARLVRIIDAYRRVTALRDGLQGPCRTAL